MITLALDTSHAVGSVALARDGVVLGEATFSAPATHLVELARAVERLLGENGLTARDVSRVAVVLGPGSFTGVRIALAFAKGLAAAGVDVVGMDSLSLLARPFFDEGRERVGAMIDAKRGEIYGAVYERENASATAPAAVVSPRAESPGAFLDAIPAAPEVFVGTGAIAHGAEILARFPRADLAPESRAFPSTAYLASIGHLLPAFSRDAVRTLEPVYLRASGAERKRLRSHAPAPESSPND
jgi:tRNA threonylcarbamoyladenosine biosynthesis protein TsaB